MIRYAYSHRHRNRAEGQECSYRIYRLAPYSSLPRLQTRSRGREALLGGEAGHAQCCGVAGPRTHRQGEGSLPHGRQAIPLMSLLFLADCRQVSGPDSTRRCWRCRRRCSRARSAMCGACTPTCPWIVMGRGQIAIACMPLSSLVAPCSTLARIPSCG